MSNIYKVARTVAFAAAVILGSSLLGGSSSACDAPVYATKYASYYRHAPRPVTYYSPRYVRRSEVTRVRYSSYRAVRTHVTRVVRVAY